MPRKILLIGIGAGDPDYVTIQAVDAMNRVDVFFIPDKGTEKADLARIRREIIERHVRNRDVRSVPYVTPTRCAAGGDYEGAVTDWHDDLAGVFGRLIFEELGPSETGAFLVWGDPTLYDSTLRILDALKARGSFELDYDVIPGITSAQALAARHKVALNTIGQSVLVTNGRRAAEGFPNTVDSIVVMLDVPAALGSADGDLDADWGANIGLADEVLVAGKLKDIVGDIERIRAETRRQRGWVMDTLLLRKPPVACTPDEPRDVIPDGSAPAGGRRRPLP